MYCLWTCETDEYKKWKIKSLISRTQRPTMTRSGLLFLRDQNQDGRPSHQCQVDDVVFFFYWAAVKSWQQSYQLKTFMIYGNKWSRCFWIISNQNSAWNIFSSNPNLLPLSWQHTQESRLALPWTGSEGSLRSASEKEKNLINLRPSGEKNWDSFNVVVFVATQTHMIADIKIKGAVLLLIESAINPHWYL